MHIVTGGAGFIGSNIAAELEARGEEVAVVDWLGTDEKWRNIAKRRLADLIAPEQVFEALAEHKGRVKSVIHMGAISATTERDADLIAETNFRLSKRLWTWCAEAGTPFVYASSAATYGEAGFEDRDDADSLSKLRPLNAYGWSKHFFDRWARHEAERGAGAPPVWAGLKFFNVYGPNEAHKGGMRSVAKQLHEQIRDKGQVRLFASDRPDYEDGGQMRDFVWVGDCVDIALWMVRGEAENGLYNCGSGQARSFLDLAKAAFAALELDEKIDFFDMPDQLKGRYQYFTEAAMEKLQRAGYPGQRTPLETGVARYLRDHLDQDDPYR
jgi:ADP-L-glycero-D-manno-heptose 6-epimerase